jgi:2-keto-4-pentenoate hydratase
MPNLDIESLARELQSASERGEMVSTPPSSRPGFELSAAYEVKSRLRQWRAAKEHRSAGRKVWRVLKLETLVWGHLYDDTVHQADGNSALLAISHPRSLKIEPEIVFGLKQALTSETSDRESALEALNWLALGFDIIGCAFPEWRFQPSDFAASYGLDTAVGDRPTHACRFRHRPQACGRTVSVQGANVQEWGIRGRELRQELLPQPGPVPGRTGPWLARGFPDEPLSRGKSISSGTLTVGHATQPGDEWRCDVEGLPLSSLRLRLD